MRPREHGTRQDKDRHQRGHALDERPDRRSCRAVARRGEHGHEQHHRHHREVLEEQDAGGGEAVRRVELAPLVVDLEHDRRARERNEEAREQRRRPREAEPSEPERGGADRARHLERPARDHTRQDAAQPVE